jgi:superfamily II DNA or RNA helicase
MSDEMLVEKIDEVYFKIHCSYEQAVGLKNHMSCFAPNHVHSPRFKARAWDGKISFFNMQTQLMPIGLVDKLTDFAFKNDYDLNFAFEKSEFVDDISEQQMQDFYRMVFNDTDFFPRDYQHTAIHSALNARRGVIEAGTGAGKSLCIYSIIRYAMAVTKGKFLLVVPRISLVNQMFSDFVEYGWDEAIDNICVLHAGNPYDGNKRILISTWQSIYKKGGEFFEQFESVVVDEVHGVSEKSTALRAILGNCNNARYRFGLTGTLPTFPADLYNIVGYLGPRVSQISSKELMDRGVLSDLEIINILIRYTDAEIKKSRKMNYPEEVSFIIDHPLRNKVFGFILKNINRDENSLILCDRLAHLESICKYLSAKFPDRKIVKIHGAVDAKLRETIRKDIDNENGTIIVATYATLSTGVNIKKLHNVFFASSSKSMIKVLQSIGRGLRKHEDKKMMRLWDLVDDLRWKKRTGTIGENYVFEHFVQRYAIYKKQGFKCVNKTLKIQNVKD